MSVSVCQLLSNFSIDIGSQKILFLAEQDVRGGKMVGAEIILINNTSIITP